MEGQHQPRQEPPGGAGGAAWKAGKSQPWGQGTLTPNTLLMGLGVPFPAMWEGVAKTVEDSYGGLSFNKSADCRM